jgi:hypothetical protein
MELLEQQGREGHLDNKASQDNQVQLGALGLAVLGASQASQVYKDPKEALAPQGLEVQLERRETRG